MNEIENKNEVVKSENKLAFKKDFSDSVMNSINQYSQEGRLVLPKNYSPENAIKSAWLKMQEIKDIAKCTPTSIANSLLEMVIMGLNPAKDQCYFIQYGNKLEMLPSYFGKITALKRIPGIESVNAQVIYEGDDITYDMNSDGRVSNIKHKQQFSNIKEDKIIGGYCVIVYNGTEYGTIATMEQIQESWDMSKAAKNKSKYRTEFVKRTLISKATKWFINTIADEDLLISTIKENENRDFDEENSYSMDEVIIEEYNANEPSDIPDADFVEKVESNNDSEVYQFE